MKKIKLFLIVTVLIFSFTDNTFAKGKKKFSGTITYNITYPDNSLSSEVQAMMPATMSITIKGMMTKTEIPTAMVNTIQIIDTEKKTGYQLMDIMGQKYAIKTTAKDLEKGNDVKDVNIKYLDEHKTIAGIECKKAEINYKTEDDSVATIFIYYSDEIGNKSINVFNPLYKNIKGVLMEYIIEGQNDIKMKFTAISVKKRRVSKKEFEVPKDYQITTQDELKAMFGG